MNRREALRLLAAGAAVPLAPHNLLASMREARRLVGPPDAPRTLNPHQYATVKIMAEMILPRTDTPGAIDVGAPEFIDLILTEWYADEDRKVFLDGLANVDTSANTLFGKDFIDMGVAQQQDILRLLGGQMREEAETVRDGARGYRAARAVPQKNFYYMLRKWTLTAYYTSEAGATQELHFEIIPDHYDGCSPISQPAPTKGDKQ